jgi:hypothetical protein
LSNTRNDGFIAAQDRRVAAIIFDNSTASFDGAMRPRRRLIVEGQDLSGPEMRVE